MKNVVIQDPPGVLFDLYSEALKLSGALRVFAGDQAQALQDVEDVEILEFTAKYAAAVSRLNELNSKILSIGAPAGADSDKCFKMRSQIRANLDEISASEKLIRCFIQERQTYYKDQLAKVRKQRNVSAYMRSPLIGRSDAHTFDRLK